MWECNKKCSNVQSSLTAKCKIVTKNSLFMFLDTNYCLLFRFFFWVINCMNYVTLLCLQHLWFRQRSNNCILMQTRLPFKIGKWKCFCIYVTGYENNIVKSPVGEHETTVKLVSRNTNQKNLWVFLKLPWGCGAMYSIPKYVKNSIYNFLFIYFLVLLSWLLLFTRRWR